MSDTEGLDERGSRRLIGLAIGEPDDGCAAGREIGAQVR